MNLQQAYDNITEHLKAGRLADCAEPCRQILARQPDNADILHLMGLAAYACGDPAAALQWIDRAILLNPDSPDYHNNRGTVLQALGRVAEAAASFQTALRLRPDFPVACKHLADLLRRNGRATEAIEAYHRVLASQPENTDALNQLSVALHDTGRFAEALDAATRALAIQPDYIEAMDNQAIALRALGRPLEAIEVYRQAIIRQPQRAVLHNNIGTLLKEGGRIEQAIEAFRSAIALDATLSEAHNNIGVTLKDQGKIDEAIACHEAAMALKPDDDQVQSNRIYAMHFSPACDARAIQAALAQFNRKWRQPIRPHPNNRDPDRRLRIGYVSPDLREHVVGWNLLPLLEQHDHRHFEIFCYSGARHPDAMTDRIRAAVDHWRIILGKTDDEAEEMIRRDGIDILVDLTLHMAANRLRLFARKPAPIQVTYLGYCGSTGLEAVDYRFSDPHLDPPGTDHLYAETTIRLPKSYWCYRPGGATPDITPLPDQITFACLNNFGKVSQPALDLWQQILRHVPDARLLLHSQPGAHLDAVRTRFGNAVEFVGNQQWPQYIQTYQNASISLDPFPYNGGITTCDSLWMGVPVVALSGQIPVGRAGRTLLSQVGLQELIAESPEEYLKLVVELAQDRPRLTQLRATLRQRMQASSLMDAQGRAGDIEAAYRQMWRRWVTESEAEPHYMRGLALTSAGKPHEAIAAFAEADRLAPNKPGTHYSMGVALADAGRTDEAIAAYRTAIRLKPDSAEAHNNLGNLLRDQGDLDGATAMFEKAIEINPGFVPAHNNLGNTRKDQGRLDQAIECFRTAMHLIPDPAIHSNLLFALHCHPDYDAQALLAAHLDWDRRHARPLAAEIRPHPNNRDPDRRLRIGYASPDFRNHPVGRSFRRFIEHHDRQKYEIFFYSDLPHPDEISHLLNTNADVWRDTGAISDRDLANQIRQDQIDLLVDPTLHTARNRLLTFARKPAPIQLTLLGPPATTGLSTMDYRITDPHLDPPGVTDADYSERSIRLPHCFWCYHPWIDMAKINALPALESGHITFGCFNALYKVTAPALNTWAAIMRQVPTSRLLMRAAPGSHREDILKRFGSEGIERHRIEFFPTAIGPEYGRLYHRTDICLDPFPYNGHTSSMDALWMGVPIVTLAGKTGVGRGGVTILSNLNLTEFIAQTPEEYISLAARAAENLPKLAELRAALRSKMGSSPLMNGRQFAADLEAAYRQMWRTWMNH